MDVEDIKIGKLIKFKWNPDLDPPIDNAGGPYGPWQKDYPIYAHIATGLIEGVNTRTLTTSSGDLSAPDPSELGDFGLGPPTGYVEVEILNVVGPPSLIHVHPDRLLEQDHKDPTRSRRCNSCGYFDAQGVDFPVDPFVCPNGCDAGFTEEIIP